MNREIKFRAWDKLGKTMQAVHSLEMPLLGDMGQIVCDSGTVLVSKNRGSIELMQYIGLKDKNGREIYEGDIVSFNMPMATKPQIREIIYKSHGFMVKQGDYFPPHDWNPEVIGNIYENPELLK